MGAGKIGGVTPEMDAAVKKFMGNVADFHTALGQINSAVANLMAAFWGNGSVAYQNAMGKWNKDTAVLVQDLEQLTKGLGTSSSSLVSLDQEIAGMFGGYGG